MLARQRKIISSWEMWFFVGMLEMKKKENMGKLKIWGRDPIEFHLSERRIIFY